MMIKKPFLIYLFLMLTTSLVNSTNIYAQLYFSIEELLGKAVYLENKKIGQIESVLINRGSGRVGSIIVRVPIGIIKLDYRHYIIPIEKIRSRDKELILCLERADFLRAPYIPDPMFNYIGQIDEYLIHRARNYYDRLNYEIGYESMTMTTDK